MATLIVVEDVAHPSVIGRGGHAMLLLQTLEGLRRLGHRVVFVEFLPDPPEPAQVRYFEEVIRRWWSPEAAGLLDLSGRGYAGLAPAEVSRAAGEAAAVITLAAHYRREPWPLLERVRPRVLVEQYPGYTQLWAAEGDPFDVYGEQDAYFTLGTAIGTRRCSLPTLGIDWRPAFNPVVLDRWAGDHARVRDRFTTVGAWRDYGYFEFDGRVLGPKVDEFEKFIALPKLAGEPLELALAIDRDDPDRERLLANGWLLESPRVAATPERYRDYVTGSIGEFAVAKGGYVGTHSGWFNDPLRLLTGGRPSGNSPGHRVRGRAADRRGIVRANRRGGRGRGDRGDPRRLRASLVG